MFFKKKKKNTSQAVYLECAVKRLRELLRVSLPAFWVVSQCLCAFFWLLSLWRKCALILAGGQPASGRRWAGCWYEGCCCCCLLARDLRGTHQMFPNRILYKCLTLSSPLRAQLGTLQGYSPEANWQCERQEQESFCGSTRATDAIEKQYPTVGRRKRKPGEWENCLQPSKSCNLLTMLRGKKIKFSTGWYKGAQRSAVGGQHHRKLQKHCSLEMHSGTEEATEFNF